MCVFAKNSEEQNPESSYRDAVANHSQLNQLMVDALWAEDAILYRYRRINEFVSEFASA